MKKNGALDIRGFKPDYKQALTTRAAHFLHWAAINYPRQYTPYNVLVKAVQGYSKMPQLKSEEVERMRAGMTRVREILRTRFQRELDSVPGIGVRATVDSADTLTVSLPKRMRRLESAKKAVTQTVSLIDTASIPDTAEMKPWKAWLNKDVGEVMKAITSPDFEKKLLPPAKK